MTEEEKTSHYEEDDLASADAELAEAELGETAAPDPTEEELAAADEEEAEDEEEEETE